ncbi:glycoside hydrolase [Xylaria digitata]|nr:glycoside hydrolase [Xylaria digitata]
MAPSSLKSLFKVATTAAVLIAPLAQCHLSFVRIAHNGVWQDPLRYMRNKTTPYEEAVTTIDYPFTRRFYNDPTWPIDYPESVRCGRDNMAHAPTTEILTVRAGDRVAFAHHTYNPGEWTAGQFDCPDGRGTCSDKGYNWVLFHEGPVVAHLSKVPDGQDVHTYDGAGEWVKIYTLGVGAREPADVMDVPFIWLPQNDGNMPPLFEFSIPPQTPPGQYLLRIDLIWPGATMKAYNDNTVYAQMYPSCAQIQVESDAIDGMLPKGIKIPEDLSPSSPGINVSEAMRLGTVIDEDYLYPGGLRWDGEKLIVDKPVY